MKPDLNKIIEQFNKLNDQSRYGILGWVVALILLLDAFLLVWPQFASISDINGQIKKISEDTQQVLTDRARLGSLKKGLQEARNSLSLLNLKVRPIQEVPSILSTISSFARDYNVKIDQLIPEYAQVETLTAGGGKYYTLPVLIKARCGYHHFGLFLNKMENGEMSFIMKDFIVQNDESSFNTRSITLTIKLVLAD